MMKQRAKNKFRHVKTESSRRLSVVYKKIGKKWVLKARPYYDLLRQSQKVIHTNAHTAFVSNAQLVVWLCG